MNTIDVDIKKEMLSRIQQGKEGIILLKGISMEPALSDGTILYVQRQSDYFVGDIVVFSYPGEGYLVHRIIEIQKGAILCRGDNARRIEVIMQRQILGKVMRFKPRKDQERIDLDNVYLQIHSSMQYMLARDLINDLNAQEINYVIVKGAPLAYYKTGSMAKRMSGDIDILISREDIARVVEILQKNDFQSSYKPSRKEHILVVSSSHQLPTYSKKKGGLRSEIDVNFDLFWGEYTGKRIDVDKFVRDSVEMEVYGCKIKTLPPLKMLLQVILHHYKEMNSLYHLTGHVAIKKRLFEDIYLLCKRYPEEISVDSLYKICSEYELLCYAYYIFYYTRKVYEDEMLDVYLEVLRTEEGEALLAYYGLTEQERRKWKIPFEERIDRDVSAVVYSEMTESDREKVERNRRLFG